MKLLVPMSFLLMAFCTMLVADYNDTHPASYAHERKTVLLASRCRTIPPKDLSVLQGMRRGTRPSIYRLQAVDYSLKREFARERRDQNKTWVHQALRQFPKQKQGRQP